MKTSSHFSKTDARLSYENVIFLKCNELIVALCLSSASFHGGFEVRCVLIILDQKNYSNCPKEALKWRWQCGFSAGPVTELKPKHKPLHFKSSMLLSKGNFSSCF